MSRYRRLKIEGGAFFFTLRSPTGRSAVSTAMLCKAYRPAIGQGTRPNYLEASVNEGVGTALRAFAPPTLAKRVTVGAARGLTSK
jgi:hypothetical protein